jgi:hypothetical protein
MVPLPEKETVLDPFTKLERLHDPPTERVVMFVASIDPEPLTDPPTVTVAEATLLVSAPADETMRFRPRSGRCRSGPGFLADRQVSGNVQFTPRVNFFP